MRFYMHDTFIYLIDISMKKIDAIKEENEELLTQQAFVKEFLPDVTNIDMINKEKIDIEHALFWNWIDFVFYLCPSLKQIGTQEQYAEYIKTIFPNSIHKNIVYHGSKQWNKFEKFEHRPSVNFNYNHDSFFFTTSIADAETGWTWDKTKKYTIVPAVLNISKKYVWILEDWHSIDMVEDRWNSDKEKLDNLEYEYIQWLPTDWETNYNKDNYIELKRLSPNLILKEEYRRRKKIGIWKWDKLIMDLSDNLWYIGDINEDKVRLLRNKWVNSIILDDPWLQYNLWLRWDKNRFIVFNPQQIHILWSKSDIESFRNFVKMYYSPH